MRKGRDENSEEVECQAIITFNPFGLPNILFNVSRISSGAIHV
jgi:hypothetical protein